MDSLQLAVESCRERQRLHPWSKKQRDYSGTYMSRKQINTPAKSTSTSINEGSGNSQLIPTPQDKSLSVEVEFLEDTENRWGKIFQLLEEAQSRSPRNTH